MTSALRKIKRKQQMFARKQFMKDFKKRMSQFKEMVACTKCGRKPFPGENIDEWRIAKYSENINLTCSDCFLREAGEHD